MKKGVAPFSVYSGVCACSLIGFHTYIYTYIYIYILRERERERENIGLIYYAQLKL